MVSVREESRIDLGEASIESLAVGVEVIPFRNPLHHGRELRALWNCAHFLLPLDHLLAVLVPPHIELSFIFVTPLLGHMVGRVACAERQVEQPWLVRVY